MMDESKESHSITLKNGATANVREALSMLGYLRFLNDEEPKLFAALVALAQGRPNDAIPEHVQALPRGNFTETGEVRGDLADVLLSSLQDSKEGTVLVSPFRLAGEADKLLVQRTAKDLARTNRDFGNWLQGMFDGRSRE